MRILTLTTLYPHAGNPTHGVFVENRLREVAKDDTIKLRVIAPVPWFPSQSSLFGAYALHARAPAIETRHGIQISHPRYFLPPKVGMTYAVQALTRCFLKAAQALILAGEDFDVIDAHYYYPDGVAAVNVAEALSKPVVITARGTDINLIPRFPKQREMILGAAAGANASITVCQALKDEMVRLGASDDKITVLRNGVDLSLFRPLDRAAIRQQMGLNGPVLLSVGHLIERKGHDLAIRALAEHKSWTLLIAGAGPEERTLRKLSQSLGLDAQVRFIGRIPHADLPRLYNAADILLLASSREGWPNVLLEAMACGTPCVASPVWGTGEVIAAPEAGRLAPSRDATDLAATANALLTTLPERTQTRAYAEKFSWVETAQGVRLILRQAINTYRPPTSSPDAWQVDRPLRQQGQPSKLLITVDTEEIFNWQENRFDQHSLADPADIDRFQSICTQHSIKPLYFITWPLLQDPPSVTYFQALYQQGKADLGLHLHQWVTPPHNQENTLQNSFQCNLSPALHRAKLAKLVDAFETAFGFMPIAHRAGRYGVAPHIHEDLVDAGILYDFSPNAGGDQSGQNGPDFSGVTSMGWIRKARQGQPELVCLPVTGGRSFRKTQIFLPQPEILAGRDKPLSPILKNLTALRRLSPEGFELQDLTHLADFLLKQQTPILTYSLHSTSLTKGATPYSQTNQDIAELLEKTNTFFTWFAEKKGGTFAALSDIQHAARRNAKLD